MNPLIASPTALPNPRERAKYTAMLALAEQLLAGREAHRAGLVEKDEPIGDAVENSVRLGRALVAQWRWVLDADAGELPLCDWPGGWWGAWPHELEADAVGAAERARRRAASGDEAAIELAERCEVLAWYQYRDSSRLARIVNAVDLDRYRARVAAEQAREAA